jgi:hypothetical protein
MLLAEDDDGCLERSGKFWGCHPSHLHTYTTLILFLASELLLLQTILLLDKTLFPRLLVEEFSWLGTLLPVIILSFLTAIGHLVSFAIAKLFPSLRRKKSEQEETCPDWLLKLFGIIFFGGLAFLVVIIGLQSDEFIRLSDLEVVFIAWGILVSIPAILLIYNIWLCACVED